MFRKSAITFLFLMFLGIGFFWLLTDQRLDNQNPQNIPSDQDEAVSYCLFKKGSMYVEQGIQYCAHGDQVETVNQFFDRLGA